MWRCFTPALLLPYTFLIAALYSNSPSFAQSSSDSQATANTLAATQLKTWPETFYQKALGDFDKLRYRIVDSIFDSGTDLDLFNNNFGSRFSAGVEIQRNVYNNFNLGGTWTVVDLVRVKTHLKLLSLLQSDQNSTIPEGLVDIPQYLKFGRKWHRRMARLSRSICRRRQSSTRSR